MLVAILLLVARKLANLDSLSIVRFHDDLRAKIISYRSEESERDDRPCFPPSTDERPQ